MQLQFGKYLTALDAAEKGVRNKIAQLLIKYGAKREESQSRVEEEDDSDWVTEKSSDSSDD